MLLFHITTPCISQSLLFLCYNGLTNLWDLFFSHVQYRFFLFTILSKIPSFIYKYNIFSANRVQDRHRVNWLDLPELAWAVMPLSEINFLE
jgi:hypothetical protein